MNMNSSRRKFLKHSGVVTIAAPFVTSTFRSCNKDQLNEGLDVHVFSKHLQFLNLKEAATVASEIGFIGLDLTVRPKGHVLPENVKTDLPKAIQDIKQAGSSCKMITTAVSDVKNQKDIDVVATAAREGIKFYRSNWFSYKEELSLEASLDHYKEKVRQLGALNKEHNIIGCYQNHSGTKIGASVWEVRKLLETVNSDFFGTQYDIRHAVVEGGQSWPNGVKLLQENIKTIVLKDFKWGQVNGKWKIVNVPIGDGMVDFDAYFKLLKSLGLKPPVCLHLEYPLGGADKGKYKITVDHKVVFDAMRKDLAKVQKLWTEA